MRVSSMLMRCLCYGLLGLAVIHGQLRGAEPARDGALIWQFKPGEALRWTLDQTIQLRAPQEGKIAEVIFKQTVDFDVDVASVEAGIATLAISTARVRVEITDPSLPGGKMSYDSAPMQDPAVKKKAEPADKAAPTEKEDGAADLEKLGNSMLAGMAAPIRDLKFSVSVDKQCDDQAITIDEKQLQAFKSVRPMQSYMILFEKSGFSSAYLGGFVKLPAGKITPGQTWSSKVVSYASGPFGKANFEHILREDGTAQVNGQELRKFSTTVQMAFDGPKNPVFELGKQTGTGILYFDEQHGRVPSSQWTLTSQILFGGGKAEGQLKMETNSQIRDRATTKAK